MEELIKQAFLHVEIIGPHVAEGHYDLIGPNGEIVLPQVWDTIIEPDWSVTMHMWPMSEPKPAPPRPHQPVNIFAPPPPPAGGWQGGPPSGPPEDPPPIIVMDNKAPKSSVPCGPPQSRPMGVLRPARSPRIAPTVTVVSDLDDTDDERTKTSRVFNWMSKANRVFKRRGKQYARSPPRPRHSTYTIQIKRLRQRQWLISKRLKFTPRIDARAILHDVLLL